MSQVWTALGHAHWRVDTPEASILFDPVLTDTYHDGVFRMDPERRFEPSLTRTGVLAISHRHPDHFDVRSLGRLVRQDPERLVLSPDPLVLSVCRRLGFRWVREFAPGTLLSMGHLQWVSTPSRAPVREWGMILHSPGATVWNMVDADAGDPKGIPALLADVGRLVGDSRISAGLDVLIARWQPLQQVAAVTGAPGGFPRSTYRSELERIRACRPKAVVPGASGTGYADSDAWMAAHAYPVPEERFLKDVAALLPGVAAHALVPGLKMTVEGGETSFGRDERVEVVTPQRRNYAPFEIPPLTDDAAQPPSAEMKVEHWLTEEAAPALAAKYRLTPLVLSLRCVFSDRDYVWSVVIRASGVEVVRGDRPDWDARVEIAGSLFLRVLERKSPWGTPLLSGKLRASNRCLDVSSKGIRDLRLPAIWLYAVLPYERVFEEWVEQELRQVTNSQAC